MPQREAVCGDADNEPHLTRNLSNHYINELDTGDGHLRAINVNDMKCWNCWKAGHGNIDCREEKTVFCYGCGALNMYKPNCERYRRRQNFQPSDHNRSKYCLGNN